MSSDILACQLLKAANLFTRATISNLNYDVIKA